MHIGTEITIQKCRKAEIVSMVVQCCQFIRAGEALFIGKAVAFHQLPDFVPQIMKQLNPSPVHK